MFKINLHKIKIFVEKPIEALFSLIPCQNNILFESEGDFSDNTYAFYDYLKKEGYFKKKYKAVWLLSNMKNSKDGCICLPKTTKCPNFRRLYYIATSKFFIFDHCNILSEFPARKRRKIINLYHGCGFKRAKGGVDKTDTEDMMPITGDFWKSVMAKLVACSEAKIHSLGYPRNDYFFMERNEKQKDWLSEHSWDKFDKIILWMPTFRKSYNRTISEDYFAGSTGLPILKEKRDLMELNEILSQKNALLVFKVHHLQMDCPAFKDSYSNIQILKDEDINSFDLQLYQIVSLTDILITDYSSICNDYLLLNKPMIFTLDDYDDYRASRGFGIDDPAQYFPGHHVIDKKQLFDAILETIKGEDPYMADRHKLLPLMHKYQDGNSCKRIAEFIGL